MWRARDDAVFVFDEPTIGLHPLDVETLLAVFDRLVAQGATVLVIEHDLDVIRNADYLLDLGPGGGERGGTRFDDDGLMRQGIIVRHLVLPGHVDDSLCVLDRIWNSVGDVPISVMNQYTPNAAMRRQGGELARAVTDEEYECVLDHADDLGFTTMYWQQGGAVDESFTPAFDTTGVLSPAIAPTARRGQS